jgi:hypothetical protein
MTRLRQSAGRVIGTAQEAEVHCLQELQMIEDRAEAELRRLSHDRA